MNPAEFTLSAISPTLASKAIPTPTSSAPKNGKAPVPRVELEAIYTQLKSALGDQWVEYKAAVNQFLLGISASYMPLSRVPAYTVLVGNLNQAELSWVLQPLLSAAPSVVTSSASPTPALLSPLHLHNSLLIAVYANLARDPPPTDVAPWVVATDKPSAGSKASGTGAGSSDQAEERLKKEVMGLHARDRRRIKTLKETPTSVNDPLRELIDYRNELDVKGPSVFDTIPQSAGGLTKANRDVEIRRRYAQQIASETLEFPTQTDIQDRLEPISAEQGLTTSSQTTLQSCAELVEQATEVYLKEMLGHLWSHVRSNGEGCIQTSSFRRQLRKEEQEGAQRGAGGLLPVEMELGSKRSPLDIDDLRMSLQVSDPYLRQDRFLQEEVLLNRWPNLDFSVKPNGVANHGSLTNGVNGMCNGDAMNVDDDAYWKGGTKAAHDELMGVLDDCLAIG